MERVGEDRGWSAGIGGGVEVSDRFGVGYFRRRPGKKWFDATGERRVRFLLWGEPGCLGLLSRVAGSGCGLGLRARVAGSGCGLGLRARVAGSGRWLAWLGRGFGSLARLGGSPGGNGTEVRGGSAALLRSCAESLRQQGSRSAAAFTARPGSCPATKPSRSSSFCRRHVGA